MLYPDTIYPHGLLGDDGVGSGGEAEVGAADEFYLDAGAASVVVRVAGIAGHVADADDLHAEEVFETNMGVCRLRLVGVLHGGIATAHGT